MPILLIMAMLMTFVSCPISLYAGEFEQGNNEDEKAIRQLVEMATASWERGDALAMASLFAADVDLIDPEGRTIKGQNQIKQALSKTLNQDLFKGSRLNAELTSIRFIIPSVAVADGTWEISRFYGHEQVVPGFPMSIMPPTSGLFVAVVMKKNGKWALVAVRAMTIYDRKKF